MNPQPGECVPRGAGYPYPRTDDLDAEFDAILDMVEKAGLVEVYEGDGQQYKRLTPEGEKSAYHSIVT